MVSNKAKTKLQDGTCPMSRSLTGAFVFTVEGLR